MMVTLSRRAIGIVCVLVVVQMALYYLFFLNTDYSHTTITKLSPSVNHTTSSPTHKIEIPTVLETSAPTTYKPTTTKHAIESSIAPTTLNPTTTTTTASPPPTTTTTEEPTEAFTQPDTTVPSTTNFTQVPTFPAPKNITLYIPPQNERQSVDSILDRTVDIAYFSDLTEKLRGSARTHQYSRFRCIGDDNEDRANSDRTCVFMNMCYDRYEDQFYFYRKNKRPVFFDAKDGLKYDFRIPYGLVRLTYFQNYGFEPKMVEGTIPPQDVTYVKPLHILFRHWKIPKLNLGHFLWEDLLGSYASIMRLGLQDEDGIIMDLNGDDGKLFKKFQPFFKGITNKPVIGFETYMNTDLNQTRHICFEQLQAGGATGVFQKEHRRYNVGREQQFRQFRDNILRRNGFDPEYVPKSHQIIVTMKTEKKFKRDIANLDEVVKFLRDTYPTIETKVVDFAKLTIKEQLELMMNTTIYITPAGGVSMMAPFLPVGAHAIFMDFHVTHPMYGFAKGESGSMEGAFWNHWAHIKRDYYQVRKEGEDYVFDHKGAKDARWFASVIVKPARLKEIVDAALEDMSA